MRDPSEKKTESKSLKMTKNQLTKYETEAAARGTSFNNYVLDTLDHAGGINPEIMIHLQNIVNAANAIAQGDTDKRHVDKMNKEEKKLWSLLK